MRPPVFNTPEELQEKIQEYLDNPTKKIKKHIKLKVGGNDKIEEVEVPVLTIGHLCYYLGFASRQSFYDYEKKDGFSYTIKRARLFIESEYEALLQVNPT